MSVRHHSNPCLANFFFLFSHVICRLIINSYVLWLFLSHLVVDETIFFNEDLVELGNMNVFYCNGYCSLKFNYDFKVVYYMKVETSLNIPS
jgi:hypothetical protein